MKKSLFFVISTIIILCALSLGAYAFNEQKNLSVATDNVHGIVDGAFTDGSVYFDGVYTEKLDVNYSQEAIQSIEKTIYDGYINLEEEINVYSYKITADMLRSVLTEIRDSNPRVFHVDRSYRYSYDSSGYIYGLLPEYTMTKNQYSEALEFFNAEIQKIIAPAKDLTSDLEKILYFHDYICLNYEYDESYQIYDAYNMLLNKKGVCQGYTLLMIACAKELGIEMSWAQSSAMNHIWNVVNIDGEYYHIDATWDDPLRGNPFNSLHTYFMLSDKEMLNRKHYSWRSNYTCTSFKYDSAFWQEVKTPFVSLNNNLYYIDTANNAIGSFDCETLETQNIKTFNYKWYASLGSTSYYPGMWSGISVYNNLIYINSPDKILAYDPISGREVTVYSHTITQYYICSSLVTDGKINLNITSNPSLLGTVYVVDLDVNYKATWVYDGNSDTKSLLIGTIPQFTGEILSYYLDENCHMAFSHWDSDLAPIMSDTIFTAVYVAENHNYVNSVCECGAVHSEDSEETTDGFKEEDGKLYYYKDGKKASGWFEVEGVKYYASSATNVVINYSKKISGKYYIWNDETGLEIADGFVTDENGTKCYEDGVQVIGWRHADGSGPKVVNGISEQYSSNPEGLYYFLSTTGYMVTSSTYKLGGYNREFNEDHTVKPMNGLQTNAGELYYYVDGVKQTGWQTIDGVTYYFRASDAVYGRAATKWMYIGNKVYYFYASTSATPYALKDEGKIGGIEYTYHEDGYILYNGFVNCDFANAANSNTAANIQKMNGTTRYYKNGEMQTGWQQIGGNWYYFYAIGSSMGSGYMCVESRKIGGVYYEFTPDGVCLNK